MFYGNIKPIDTADGDGVRVSLFVSGCRNHCKGCFSEDTWDFEYGKPFTPIEEFEIIEVKKGHPRGARITRQKDKLKSLENFLNSETAS